MLPKAYDARAVEAHWYRVWQDAGVFTPDVAAVRAGAKRPYVIMMPPPNVTGSLHMGHALFVTLQDILIRTHRMRGEAALWLPGVDHAGIATQTVVERELKRHEGKTRHDLGRASFLERVWQWKEKNGDRIVTQLKAMGASADWTRARFTMDEQCNRAVKEAFVRLWHDGLIYRGERLVNWDPATGTGLSDEEVEHEEKDGELWRFAYQVKDAGPLQAKSFASPQHDDGRPATVMLPADDALEIVVATTRPETMLGDVAVAVHPDDERHAALIGRELVHPFFPERRVVVVADPAVDRELGTGAVKITPAHDPNDFELGLRHALPMINIFTLHAATNENAGVFEGLDRFVARKKVKAALEQLGLFRGTTPIRHNVSVSQRSGAVIEPLLSRQFFVKTRPFAEKALAVVESGETRIIPDWWKKTWDHFMHNIRDWNVSRQLWWGHRVPVFYDLTKLDEVIETDANRKGKDTAAVKAQADGVRGRELLKIALGTLDDELVMKLAVASTEELEARQPDRYVQEDDVLDTWFSSGLWPFSTLGWPDQTDDLAAFYPGAVLETGSDILFFWVARMVWLGSYFMGRSPFSDVFLHAMVRDGAGKKMSKSEGNAVDPLDVIAGISLPDLLAKTRTYPVPDKKLAAVLKSIEKEFPEGIPAAGADGLRFTLAALSAHGRDVKLSIPRAAGYRAFLNKIWNATRFVLMRVGDAPIPALAEANGELSLGDRWILSRLQRAVQAVSGAIDTYRFDEAANAIYQFFWTELCDVYVEISKGAIDKPATRATLVHVLDSSLRLLHPLCPFQTEEIWQKLPGRDLRWPATKLCALAPWPTPDLALVDERAEREMQVVLDAVTMARNVRQESGLGPRAPVAVDLVTQDQAIFEMLGRHAGLIARLAVLSSASRATGAGYSAPRLSGMQSNGVLDVVVHLAGLIDVDKEKARLLREIEKAQKDKAGLEKRFANEEFVKRAPPEVVEEGRVNLRALDEKVARLTAALGRLS
ncbi:MAG: valine--tRNA ligase [Deltaproteobacteria bacterium RBG_16_71_12]|nr:MAG: valine--tRNA ligase [Deltaproteobacteria bacterium RBG_16_71_12]